MAKAFPGTYEQYMKLSWEERRWYTPPSPPPTLTQKLKTAEIEAKQKIPFKPLGSGRTIEPEAREAYIEYAKTKVVKEHVLKGLPEGSEITKVIPTDEGYQIEYTVPGQPVPQPT
ncbi:MAG: hypothetical protein OEX77_11890, partial [Candidatus Bathyarchaeota archaeon]|nr:hypothetical protein [Candidatus Bathyarchaeota archaeon]